MTGKIAMSKSLNQMSIVTSIMKEIERQGIKNLFGRQMNDIIKAANIVCETIARPFVPATPGMGLKAWLECDDTGLSSKYLACVLTGSGAVPEAKKNFDRLFYAKSKEWRILVKHWGELEELYLQELQGGNCPKLYERMKDLITEVKE